MPSLVPVTKVAKEKVAIASGREVTKEPEKVKAALTLLFRCFMVLKGVGLVSAKIQSVNITISVSATKQCVMVSVVAKESTNVAGPSVQGHILTSSAQVLLRPILTD
jgi:hypothetical protein